MSDFYVGLGLVIVAGILAGGCSAPIKLMHRFRYEHWALISVLTGMFFLPWLTLAFSVDLKTVLTTMPMYAILKANLFSLSWGIANVLAGLCLIRIGFSLTGGLMTGIGLPIGVLFPMIFRGSGMFADAPSLFSRAGVFIGIGIVIMLAALLLITLAGFGKEHGGKGQCCSRSGFAIGLLMMAFAGVLQVGLSFAFVYGYEPINDTLRANGAGPIGMLVGVWAFSLPGGLLVNFGYILWRLYRNRNWSELISAPREVFLSILIGIAFLGFVVSLGFGMQHMGALGASVGFGVYQIMQVVTTQALGFVSGEWDGSPIPTIRKMKAALLLLLIAVIMFSAGNF